MKLFLLVLLILFSICQDTTTKTAEEEIQELTLTVEGQPKAPQQPIVGQIVETVEKTQTNEPVQQPPADISESSIKESVQLYRKALETLETIPIYIYRKRLLHYSNNDYKEKVKEALDLLEYSQSMGSWESKLLLADFYFFAKYGLKRDLDKAFHLYKDVALTQGNETAHFMTGLFYSLGLGSVEQNQAKALLHYQFASMGNHDYAEMALGYRHYLGIGVPESCDNGLQYYKKAADKVAKYFDNGPLGPLLPAPYKIKLPDQSQGGLYGKGVSGRQQEEQVLGSMNEDDIIQFYQYNAEKGDSLAQIILGQLYYHGSPSVPKNYLKALRYFREAAAQLPKSTEEINASVRASAQGASLLGQMYWRGDGVLQNNETAFKWFLRAAKYGNPLAFNNLGLMYMHGLPDGKKDPEKAIQFLTKAAEKKNSDALNTLGSLFMDKGDYTKAFNYFQEAAKQGHLYAIYQVANFFYYGIGIVKKDCHMALNNFKAVSEKGDYQRPLLQQAYHHFKDRNDPETAWLLYMLAAEMGYEEAQVNAAWLLDTGKLKLSSKNETHSKALVMWFRSAHQGNVEAWAKAGDYYYYGTFSETDFNKAFSCYHKASDFGLSLGSFNVAYMYENGLGVERDFHMAKRLYDLALTQNPQAYLPVTLAIIKLTIKHFFFWFYDGGSFFLDFHPAGKSHIETDSHEEDFSDLLNEPQETILNEKEQQKTPIDWEQQGFGEDEMVPNDSDLWLLALLMGLGIIIFWARQQPQGQPFIAAGVWNQLRDQMGVPAPQMNIPAQQRQPPPAEQPTPTSPTTPTTPDTNENNEPSSSTSAEQKEDDKEKEKNE